MQYLDLLITDSTDYVSSHYVHRAYISLPENCIEPIEDWCETQPQVKLTELGVKRCKQFYAKKNNWDPEYYNYKLIVLTKKEIRELKKYTEKALKDYTKDLLFFQHALDEIGWEERRKNFGNEK